MPLLNFLSDVKNLKLILGQDNHLTNCRDFSSHTLKQLNKFMRCFPPLFRKIYHFVEFMCYVAQCLKYILIHSTLVTTIVLYKFIVCEHWTWWMIYFRNITLNNNCSYRLLQDARDNSHNPFYDHNYKEIPLIFHTPESYPQRRPPP